MIGEFSPLPESTPPTLITRRHTFDDEDALAGYLELWTGSPQRTAFAHPDYILAASAAFDLPSFWLGVYEDDELCAAVPLLEKTRGPFRAAALPPLTPIFSPLLRENPRESDFHRGDTCLDTLIEALGSYHQATLQLHPSLTDTRPFGWASWMTSPRYTYVVDLTREEELLSTWSQSARNIARKENEEFVVDESNVLAPIAIDLVLESYSRQGKKLGIEGGALDTLVERVVNANLARVFAAESVARKKHEAAAIILHDGISAHFWLAGSTPGKAMTVLLGHVLGKLKDEDFELFDFVGANVPSIAEFKRSFGSELRVYYLARRIRHPLLRIANALRPLN
ncbi:MAG: GNAT family N-acetyltransferase [Rubricoccaceae bacterium]|nr:GNAT family N-acetyltransferase [Rubricoccaceae bacterium]